MSQLPVRQNALIRVVDIGYKVLGLALLTALGACGGNPPDNLGVSGGRLAPCPASPNCVSSQATDQEHRVEPLPLLGSPAETRSHLLAVLAAEPRVRMVEQQDSYLRAEFTSKLLRFVDDVEFLIGPEVVHVRSASRLGYSDLGVNRKRVEALRQKLLAQR
jgi:uncharacterized protein (DUF1499 family)